MATTKKAAAPKVATPKAEPKKEKQVTKNKIFLTKDKNLNQDDKVVVVNFSTTIIQRGKEVEVSDSVYEVLRNSDIEDAKSLEIREGFGKNV